MWKCIHTARLTYPLLVLACMKCESNALFKNDETLKAGEEICRRAIEKYYGEDALERFRKKEEACMHALSSCF